MGYLHCVESGCAEVRYQIFEKAGGIRYRYSGQDWVTVDGDDYSIDHQLDFGNNFFDIYCQCEFIHYGYIAQPFNNAQYYSYVYNNGDLVTGTSFFPGGYRGKIIDYYLEPAENNTPITLVLTIESQGVRETLYCNFSARIYNETTQPQGFNWLLENPTPYAGWGFTDATTPKISFSSNPLSENYHFIVYKNNDVVFQKTSEDKPEVEIIDPTDEEACKLSDRTQVVKIEKQPFLERVEIRDQDIRGYGIGGQLIDAAPIPENCLNIYQTLTTAPLTLSNYVPTAAIFNPYQFVEQICSDEGCPPPKYEVICNCVEECPPGTCSVVCGSSICCYDTTTGSSVKEIPISEFFPDNTQGAGS